MSYDQRMTRTDAGLGKKSSNRVRNERRGTNLPRVADYNQMLVLDLIRRSAGISRVELVQRTGLSAQTLSNIARRLVDAGLIRQSGRVHSGAGAPRTIFEVEENGRYAIGLHIDPARLTCILMNLAGDVVATTVESTPTTPDPDDVLNAIESSISTLISETGADRSRIAGIGVATPGPVDLVQGAVIGAPNLPGWETVQLRSELSARMELPVIIEKDSTAAAQGEIWNSDEKPANLAFIYLGTGVAAGIVLDGEIMRGASANIGDIGHLSADPDGPLCYCGGRGCLSATAMPATLVASAIAQGALHSVDVSDAHAVEVALAELGRMAAAGHPTAIGILDRAAHGFGRVAGQLVNTLDLDAIVFGGPQWETFRPSFLRVVPAIVERLFMGRDLHHVDVRGTSIGDPVGAVGAASLAMWSTTFDTPGRLYLTS
ncbi:putative NBD/HSP70 family sugar kinase [Paramicrobacterium agarici]|uniref:Putative NBD/HSP70 family sugar kinase n=2 Tax=Paramicrobacterium agarici TaxID=630514 RepID=A0A2A9DYV3_9MICO|nr:putative NBD/HSP70 family sugar kinase [Microbacterium agarici]TQO21764.1 putative NBD/HSP70 family sugar kinase [Microbacterium agarici]